MSSAVSLRASAVSRITAPVQCAPGLSRFRKAIVKPQRFSIAPLHSRRSSSTRSLVCMTINKVHEIVKTQLALSDDKTLTAESKFSDLGADSLDTVEIVMAFEEEFKISIEEDDAGSIATGQEAADTIDKLVESDSPPA